MIALASACSKKHQRLTFAILDQLIDRRDGLILQRLVERASDESQPQGFDLEYLLAQRPLQTISELDEIFDLCHVTVSA